jgi:PhoD related phosphatase
LDDLDDHYTAKTHKKERRDLVLRLQNLAAEFSVRVTILGGDVHLAACGRFYSNPKLGVPAIADHRYIANIISSAIVNKPPPAVRVCYSFTQNLITDMHSGNCKPPCS